MRSSQKLRGDRKDITGRCLPEQCNERSLLGYRRGQSESAGRCVGNVLLFDRRVFYRTEGSRARRLFSPGIGWVKGQGGGRERCDHICILGEARRPGSAKRSEKVKRECQAD